MRTIKQIARLLINSDKSLERNAVKNYQFWVELYTETCKNYELRKGSKTLKAELIKQGANESTVGNRIGGFNTAIRNGIDLNQFTKFDHVFVANRQVGKQTAKVVNGKVELDAQDTTKATQEREIVKAQNENMLTEILANAEFKKLKNLVAKNNWDANVVLKALLQK